MVHHICVCVCVCVNPQTERRPTTKTLEALSATILTTLLCKNTHALNLFFQVLSVFSVLRVRPGKNFCDRHRPTPTGFGCASSDCSQANAAISLTEPTDTDEFY